MSDQILRSKMIRLAASMEKGSSERKALLDVLADKQTRVASLEGPVGLVVDAQARGEAWNVLHDMENGLDGALFEYDNAASYGGGPAKQDARAMVQHIKQVKAMLEEVSFKALGKLIDAEMKFLRKYGNPSDYARQQSREMFPN